jgi:alpha-L-rhamnosidase
MNKLFALTIALLVALTFIGCKEETSTVNVDNLTCEYFTNPKGIDAASPQLAWQLKSDERGQKQTAYQILVASSKEKLAKNQGDLWDSGKIKTGQSKHVDYNGAPLSSRTECFWKVKTWGKDDKPSVWSEPAYWSMGLLSKEDWSAQWIGSPDSVTAPYYRSSFDLDEVPEKAPIYLVSLGYYELYINGKKVGDEVLAPAVSNFAKRTYFQTYDVANLLKAGKNSIAVWMGTGWYNPEYPGVVHKSPVVRVQLETPNKTVVTDESWETKKSARSQIGTWEWGHFGGELVDARLIDKQWWNTETSSEGWKSVVEVKTPDVPCTAQKCLNNAQIKEISPVAIEQLDDTTILVDFGTNLTGMMKMKFNGLESGQKIIIHYSDLDGRDPEEAWRIKYQVKGFGTYRQRDEFISAGEKEEEFHNVFNYHGYRYAIIDGLNYLPKKEDLAAIPVETKTTETGSFECSNELYNDIHKMVRWSYRALNLGGQTVDCPHRERVGYGDGQTIMDNGCFNFDEAAVYTKWSQNWWDEQAADGFVPFVAPTPHETGGGPAWGAMSVVVPWKTYLFYNDTNLLREGYPYMKKYVEFLGAYTTDGVLRDIYPGDRWSNLGDWVPPRRGMDTRNWPDSISRVLFNNCYRIRLLQIMSKVGTIVGKTDDVAVFEKEISIGQKAVHSVWFNEEDTTYANGEQPYLIFPLETGVVPEELREAVFDKYVRTMLVTDDGHLNTGMIGTQTMMDYLLENNRHDLIDIMVNKKTYPGWGYMIEKGATTAWEQWNGYWSQIHSCFPYIDSWFYRGLGGIRWDYDNPGFKNIILRPALVESTDWVKCNYESHYGNIISNWKTEADQFTWEVTIPVNSTATVYIQGDDITEGGSPIEGVAGVTLIRTEDGTSVYQVASGSYTIGSTLK